MVSRSTWPYLSVIALGVAFVAFAVYGLLTLSGDDGLGSGFGRIALSVFLVLGAVAIVVAGVDLYRHESSAD